MIRLKRLPGIIYRYKAPIAIVIFLFSSVLFVMHSWGLMCTTFDVQREIDRLCEMHKVGRAMGNLCKPLCVDGEIHSISCSPHHSKKKFVFAAKWNQRLIFIKSSKIDKTLLDYNLEEAEKFEKYGKAARYLMSQNTSKLFSKHHAFHGKSIDGMKISESRSHSQFDDTFEYRRVRAKVSSVKNEEEFEEFIRKLVSTRLNMTLTRSQLDELKYLDLKNKLTYPENSEKRKNERKNVFSLLQSQEYILSKLYSDREIFPQILGTCGHFYGVEYLESPNYHSVFTLGDKADWSERMKLAISIMDFVEEIETNFPDALHLCDVRMNHFGVTKSGRVKFLDLDLVFMKNIIDKILKHRGPCKDHKDCDFFDCKSTCNFKENFCDSGVVNDNLQIICEKIFVGWTMSSKVLVPGLLMSDNTPASLSAILRQCAENRRTAVPEDLRQRLYTTLTEMHQILIQKLQGN